MKKRKFKSAQHKRDSEQAKRWKEAHKSDFNLKEAPSILTPAIKTILQKLEPRSQPGVRINSRPTHKARTDKSTKRELTPEMEERERRAQLETEQKKLRTAPTYNKGGYMYFSDCMLEDMKTGKLRRRS